MNVVILMLAVTACYTICSLNDKYAAANSKAAVRTLQFSNTEQSRVRLLKEILRTPGKGCTRFSKGGMSDEHDQ